MKPERGYRLGNGDQVPTIPTTVAAIMAQPTFALHVVERADGGGFDAFNSTGELIGTFSTRIEASRAIPTAVSLDIIAAEADGAVS